MVFRIDVCDDCRLALGIKAEDAAMPWVGDKCVGPVRTPKCNVCRSEKTSLRFDRAEVLILALMRERLSDARDKLRDE